MIHDSWWLSSGNDVNLCFLIIHLKRCCSYPYALGVKCMRFCLSFQFPYNFFFIFAVLAFFVREITTHKTMQLYWNELVTVNSWLVRCQWQTTQNEMYWKAICTALCHIFLFLSFSLCPFLSFSLMQMSQKKADSYLFNGN